MTRTWPLFLVLTACRPLPALLAVDGVPWNSRRPVLEFDGTPGEVQTHHLEAEDPGTTFWWPEAPLDWVQDAPGGADVTWTVSESFEDSGSVLILEDPSGTWHTVYRVSFVRLDP